MKPRILVLYYTQSGQLLDILKNVVKDIAAQTDITYAAIEPEQPFPFPWKKASVFFDAMPETVKRTPGPVKPLPQELFTQDFDLVIFGYQPWFLHPSQPITAFLQSENARILKGKKVLTVIGCRNMWLNAQECVKQDLIKAGAELVGNIVLTDSYPNLISTLTVIRWAFSGQKERSRFLPPAGVQDREINSATRFGQPILDYLTGKGNLSEALLAKGAVELKPGLVLLEKRGMKNFRYWANYISEKGGPGDPARVGRVLQFKNLLLVAIFVLSPISNFTAFIQRQLQKKTLLRDVAYFKQTAFEPGRI
jgi:hypothetical protein